MEDNGEGLCFNRMESDAVVTVNYTERLFTSKHASKFNALQIKGQNCLGVQEKTLFATKYHIGENGISS